MLAFGPTTCKEALQMESFFSCNATRGIAMSSKYHFKVLYEEQHDGSYHAWVPMLPACQASGSSLTQAQTRIEQAIECYCLNMVEHGASIPQNQPGRSTYVDEVQVCLSFA